MSKTGAMYLEMSDDAQCMTLTEFTNKWGIFYANEWRRQQDPDFYYQDEPELEYD